MIGIIMSICYFIDTGFIGCFLVSQNERFSIPSVKARPATRGKDIWKRSTTNSEGGDSPPNTSDYAPAVQSPAGYLQQEIYIALGGNDGLVPGGRVSVPIETISKMLNHSSPSFTRRSSILRKTKWIRPTIWTFNNTAWNKWKKNSISFNFVGPAGMSATDSTRRQDHDVTHWTRGDNKRKNALPVWKLHLLIQLCDAEQALFKR